MSGDISEQIIKIIAEQAVLETSDVSPEKTLEDLGVDSLGLVEAIFAIEEEFDIQVPFNANEPDKSDFDISSVAAIVAAVEKLVAEQHG
ncbi:MAG: acyl carrier protein [Rhodobacteraceae bacterium]|jgi:acyl carrier protein|nr:acyl carrier protein [Paracoccaceae bacterium]QPI85762.1 acyl carrier protein [Rhodobacterales bacterium HKCCA1288]